MNRLKKLAAAVVVSVIFLHTNVVPINLYNDTSDSFTVTGYSPDPEIRIADVYPGREIENKKISGNSCIEYHADFPRGYKPADDDEPFLSFQNEKAEFRFVFSSGPYYTLRSDAATEIHNDAKKDGYDYEYIGMIGKDHSSYCGRIFNWLITGPYRVVYCNEKNARGIAVVIEYATADNSWMQKMDREDYLSRFGEPRPEMLQKMIAEGRIKIDPEPTCCSWFCCRRKKK
jgi:hypothetical protein